MPSDIAYVPIFPHKARGFACKTVISPRAWLTWLVRPLIILPGGRSLGEILQGWNWGTQLKGWGVAWDDLGVERLCAAWYYCEVQNQWALF